MRTPIAVLLSLLLCAAVLAACGSGSGSDTTNTTATATVPDGKLGAAGGEHCDLPNIAGVTVKQFDAVLIDCGEAAGHARTLVRTGRVDGWNCSTTPSSNGTSGTCQRGGSRTAFHVVWSETQ